MCLLRFLLVKCLPRTKFHLTPLTLYGVSGLFAIPDVAVVDAPTNSILVMAAFLNKLADEARTNSPALNAARSRVQAAEAERAAVRTWQDPTLMLGGAPGSDVMRQEQGDIVYGVEQRLPLWGKPKATREIAQAEIERSQAQADFEFQCFGLRSRARLSALPWLMKPSALAGRIFPGWKR